MGYPEDTVRQRVKDERGARGWTQQQLADRMAEYGHGWRWSTVAKLEAGERGIQLGEAAALADVFGVTLDLLSGRRARPVGDLSYARRALLDTLGMIDRTMVELGNVLDTKVRELTAADPNYTCAALLTDVLKLAGSLAGVQDTAARIGREHNE
jgi:transcriptional regulator with XRE-family HTH domain